MSERLLIRRELRDGDADAIVELHRRVYGAEYGMNEAFVAGVQWAVQEAAFAGWPERSGGVWLVEQETFSALTVASRLYVAAGFRVVWERERLDWGPPVTYQRYELEPL